MRPIFRLDERLVFHRILVDIAASVNTDYLFPENLGAMLMSMAYRAVGSFVSRGIKSDPINRLNLASNFEVPVRADATIAFEIIPTALDNPGRLS